MNSINSKDGTKIAYEKLGNGKPLIIIGGSLADHQMYVPLAAELSKKLTVINYDRRNRGKSGTVFNHTIQSELQDIDALSSLCNEEPIIYGHSAGAALAIRAVAEGLKINSLILADLPFTPVTDNYKSEAKKFIEEKNKIVELLHQNNKVDAVKFFLKDFGMNEYELNEFISSENGKQALANSPTLPIDYDALDKGYTPIEQLKKIQIPTLLLTSNNGLEIANDAAKYLNNCKLVTLDNPTYSLAAVEIASPIINFIEGK